MGRLLRAINGFDRAAIPGFVSEMSAAPALLFPGHPLSAFLSREADFSCQAAITDPISTYGARGSVQSEIEPRPSLIKRGGRTTKSNYLLTLPKLCERRGSRNFTKRPSRHSRAVAWMNAAIWRTRLRLSRLMRGRPKIRNSKTMPSAYARAYRRAGELLMEIDGRGGDKRKTVVGYGFAQLRTEAARQAGLSAYQATTAVRIASIPEIKFEAVVESAEPPGTSHLRQMTRLNAPPRRWTISRTNAPSS
jgi:hypothetical protein